jgi:hypothetical protein
VNVMSQDSSMLACWYFRAQPPNVCVATGRVNVQQAALSVQMSDARPVLAMGYSDRLGPVNPLLPVTDRELAQEMICCNISGRNFMSLQGRKRTWEEQHLCRVGILSGPTPDGHTHNPTQP